MRFSSLTLFCEECGAANPVEALHCFACHTALQLPPLAASSAIIGIQSGRSSAPPVTTTTPSASTLLNQRYKLIREVGRGGFGVVYKEVLSIGIELCSVLHYLHTQKPPIIFRDVKPANIMRKANGQLYLIDFGIARRFTPGQKKDTGSLGSPGYAAPEQYGRAQATVQTDIYGLGATLQTFLTGDDPSETAPSNTSLTLPKKLTRLLGQMLETDASKRPKSVEEVKNRLQDIRAGWMKHFTSFAWGLLIGAIPYLMIAPVFLSMQYSQDFLSLFNALFYALLCLSPFIFLLISA